MPLSPVEVALASINMRECYRRRIVRGRDLNDWHLDLEQWLRAGETDRALGLLFEILDVTETLEQFDDREPQPYWYEKTAEILRSVGRYSDEADVLQRWLNHWPDERRRRDRVRLRIRIAHARAAMWAAG